jgi:hypothetical protein
VRRRSESSKSSAPRRATSAPALTEWQAISQRARFSNQQEYAPLVAFLALYANRQDKQYYVQRLEQQAIVAGVIMFILTALA